MVRFLRLPEMIGGIGTEVGPAAVGLLHRPVLIVAELGRAEQGQLDGLPILRGLTLRRLQHAFIDEALGTQRLERAIDRAARLDLGLRREDIVMDAEQREIRPDQIEHLGDGLTPEEDEPLALRRLAKLRPIKLGEPEADRFQIVAGIESLRYLT